MVFFTGTVVADEAARWLAVRFFAIWPVDNLQDGRYVRATVVLENPRQVIDLDEISCCCKASSYKVALL